MSDLDTAQTGAETANLPEPQQAEKEQLQQGSDSVAEHSEEKARDEKGRFVPQERVNEITWARRNEERARLAAERERDYLRQQLQTYESHRNAPQSLDGPPKIEEYSDFNEFNRANLDYLQQQAFRAAEQRLTQQQQMERQYRVAEQFEAKANSYAVENPGFDERFGALLGTFQIPPDIAEAIALSDQSPAVFDYLAQHLDEADRIFRMPVHLAAMQVGRIEERLSRPKTKPVTNAPAPAPTLGGGSNSFAKDEEKMTDAEWLEYSRKSKRK